MSGQYAAATKVPVDRSKSQIEQILARYGARSFMYAWQNDRAVIAFEAHERQIRFELPMPDKDDRTITRTETGRPRSPAQRGQAYEQAVRSRWRALLLIVQAKLEAVAAGIVTFEDEFLAHTVTPSGATVGEWLQPQLDQAVASGAMPSIMPGALPAIEAEIVQ